MTPQSTVSQDSKSVKPSLDSRNVRPAPRLEAQSLGTIPPGVLGMIAALALKRYAEHERREAQDGGAK